MDTNVNDHLVMISGKSTTGKSASLEGLRDHEGVWYFNCESGKRLPFRNKFKKFTASVSGITSMFRMASLSIVHTRKHL